MKLPFCLLPSLLLGVLAAAASAGPPVYELEIHNHLFLPDEIRIPAATKIKLVVYNRDPTPEEFESYELNREKVIMGGRKATLFIGPLQPGIYPFFGEFNPRTAQGRVVVE
ncbi:cupredoxin domain-containing protein [Mangrovimicrobium sediminis]|uniref:Cupredoxin domain-containing protein n=1 Tax=Mangrovimicrobium sediminis TaxID=2562682 RepID=A0A4Z0M6V4_9GAMM|nr:cupredoxin domain-containing protein [Haliea sp. SAOS-164]TGD75138.1 cupredoxin domain-containing protein [Haliea sp. SAOS-164]